VNKKNKNNIKTKFSNAFGVLGYLFCFLQWLWIVLLYFELIMNLALFVSPNQPQDTPVVSIAPPIATEVSPFADVFMIVLSIIVVVIMLVLTVYFLFKIPTTIVKTSKKIIFEAAEKAVPLVLQAQHKKETKKNRIKLTPRLVLIFKAILTMAPLVLTFLSQFVENKSISFDIAMIVGIWLAAICVVNFILQYVCGRLLKLRLQDLI
jgi:hypothetical protein